MRKLWLIVTCIFVAAFIYACSKLSNNPSQPTAPSMPADITQVVPGQMDGQADMIQLPVIDDDYTWPRAMSDFKFPYRYGETWKITCGYGCNLHHNQNYPNAGYYSVDLERVYHQSAGSCVILAARGRVIYAGNGMSGYGWCVVIDHDDGHTGLGYKSIVAHLESDPRQFVHAGDDLRGGTILGYCGATGGNYVPHIHFGIWRNNVTVPINGISGYNNLVQGGQYFSYNWPVLPPRGQCDCNR